MKALKRMMFAITLAALLPGLAVADETSDAILAFVQAQSQAGTDAAGIAEALLDDNATAEQQAAVENLVAQIISNPDSGADLAAQIATTAGGNISSASIAPPTGDAGSTQDQQEGDSEEPGQDEQSQDQQSQDQQSQDQQQTQTQTQAPAPSAPPPPPPPPAGEADPSPFG